MSDALLIWAAALLYIFPPLWMLARKGRAMRAGATMLAASLLPLLPLAAAEGELSPGAGMSALAIAPLALLAALLICGGSVAWLMRLNRRRRISGVGSG